MIRDVRLDDAESICNIYNHYVVHTTVTFEEERVSPAGMAERISGLIPRFPWIVYEDNGSVIGYAYAGPWKGRSAYRFSVESTIYLDRASTGRGTGTLLYRSLIERLRAMHFHAVMGGIALPNDGSRRLHERLGFRKAAYFQEVGYKFNTRLDVEYWELILDGPTVRESDDV